MASIIGVLTAESAVADTILLNTVSRGSYIDTGLFGTGAAGDPDGNYVTGHLDFGLDAHEFRSFFVFDTSGIVASIVSAHFEADAGFWETEAPQTLAFFDVGASAFRIAHGDRRSGRICRFRDPASRTADESSRFPTAKHSSAFL